jgi:phosphate transport system permease protein
MSRQVKDNIIKGFIYASSAFTVVILAVIIGFILVKGLPKINMDFFDKFL